MGLFGSLFESESTATSKTSVKDTSQSAGGNIGARIDSTKVKDGGTLIFGSDSVAIEAINSSQESLLAATGFLDRAFSSFLTITDQSQARASANIAESQRLNASLLQDQAETADDRLVDVLKWGVVAIVAYAALSSGTVQQVIRSLK